MKIVADEGIEARLVLGLRETGFDVLYIAEEMPSLPDEGCWIYLCVKTDFY